MNTPTSLSSPSSATPPSAPSRAAPIYVVTAYRWGQRNGHSYVVGAFHDLDAAKACAEAHVDYRGGKYGAEVVEAGPWTEDTDVSGKQVFYVESPYFGIAGDSGHFHPADRDKPGHPSAKPFTVKELRNELWSKEREIEALAAQHAALTKELAEAKAEIDAYAQTQARLGELLNGVAVALRGEPKPLTAHGWDRLPEEVRQLRARCLVLEGLLEDVGCALRENVISAAIIDAENRHNMKHGITRDAQFIRKRSEELLPRLKAAVGGDSPK